MDKVSSFHDEKVLRELYKLIENDNYIFLFLKKFFNVYLFLRQRETEHERGRGRERGRHRM